MCVRVCLCVCPGPQLAKKETGDEQCLLFQSMFQKHLWSITYITNEYSVSFHLCQSFILHFQVKLLKLRVYTPGESAIQHIAPHVYCSQTTTMCIHADQHTVDCNITDPQAKENYTVEWFIQTLHVLQTTLDNNMLDGQ